MSKPQQEFLIIEVHVSVPLPAGNRTSWPDERCQKVADETAHDIAKRHPEARLTNWWVA
jgi:DNA primase